jgi:hypothetical protein
MSRSWRRWRCSRMASPGSKAAHPEMQKMSKLNCFDLKVSAHILVNSIKPFK